jgi:hypothetical protein
LSMWLPSEAFSTAATLTVRSAVSAGTISKKI